WRLSAPQAPDTPRIQFELGRALEKIESYAEALAAYKKAAGYASAEVAIGGLYSDGRGMTQNYSEAMVWYRKAADGGDAIGQFYVGTLYHQGFGVKEDHAQ